MRRTNYEENKKHIIPLFLVLAMVIIMLPQQASAYNFDFEKQIHPSDIIANTEEVELIDPTNDNEYMFLTDVHVSSELIDDSTVKITLTNSGAFGVTDWSVAYESEYDVLSIENAKIISDSEVVLFTANDTNDILKPGETTSVTLLIDGTYCDNTIYRVYGISDGIPEYYSIADFTTYDATTGTTTLDTFDIEDAKADITGSAYTESTDGNSESTTSDNEISTCTIIGTDGRTKVTSVNSTPYSRIACLIITWSDGTKSQGTGFMISPQYMLTAAHCVYSVDLGKSAKSITAYFGANGSTYSTIGYTSTSTLTSSSATINGKLRYMYKMSSTPYSVNTYVINYKIDTYKGQSGSPIYNSSNVVYGIHNTGGSSYNTGRRLTSALINAFVDNGWCSY